MISQDVANVYDIEAAAVQAGKAKRSVSACDRMLSCGPLASCQGIASSSHRQPNSLASPTAGPVLAAGLQRTSGRLAEL